VRPPVAVLTVFDDGKTSDDFEVAAHGLDVAAHQPFVRDWNVRLTPANPKRFGGRRDRLINIRLGVRRRDEGRFELTAR